MAMNMRPESNPTAAPKGIGMRSAAAISHRERADLDTVEFARVAGVGARTPRWDELPRLRDLAAEAIGHDLARIEVVRAIFCQDPAMLWAFERSGSIVGGFATLFLTREGVEQMIAGRFDFRMPPLNLLADRLEVPHGIYWWALFGRGEAKQAFPDVLAAFRSPRLKRANNWAIPITEDGVRFTTSLGFRPFPAPQPGLFRYVRALNREGKDLALPA